MSVPRFKRKPSGLDYVDNAFELWCMNCISVVVRC